MIGNLFNLLGGMAMDLVHTILGSRNPWERTRLALLLSDFTAWAEAGFESLGGLIETYHKAIGWAAAALLFGGALIFSGLMILETLSSPGRPLSVSPVVARSASLPAEDGLAVLHEISDLLAQEEYGTLPAKMETLRRLRPNDARTHQMEGVLLTATGDFSGARQAFRRSIALDPSEKVHRFNLAELEFMAGNYGEAETLFRAAQTMDQANTKIVLRRYLCALLTGKGREAEELAANLPPMAQSPDWHCLMAAKAMSEGNRTQGETLLAAARVLYSADEMKDPEKTLRRTGYLPPP